MKSKLDQNETQKLKNQICFPLYATSRLLQRLYHPLLEPFRLTYPQYIVLMILWEDAPCPISHVTERALLNTNTITPLLKRLEQQGHITRTRSSKDERVVIVSLTDLGRNLQGDLAHIPMQLFASMGAKEEEMLRLKQQLDTLLAQLAQASLKEYPY